MQRKCNCSGGCGGEVNRREFLTLMLTGTTGLMLSRALSDSASEKPTYWQIAGQKLHAPQPIKNRYPVQTPRSYLGKHLEYVLMPVGGIGAGSVWLDGQGRLAVWQVFNNFTEERLSNAYFALRIGEQLRVLQTVPEQGVTALSSLSYEGGYPIARLRFEDDSLPVQVMLEAYNPLIPLDAYHSALPCAIFRWTVRNRTQRVLNLSLIATLPESEFSQQKMLQCTPGAPRSKSNKFSPTYGALKLVSRTGSEIAHPPLFWLHAPTNLSAVDPETSELPSFIADATDNLLSGGILLVTDPRPEFWQEPNLPLEVFEDFEGGSYVRWTVKGEAFGRAPHTGTTPGQQHVSGFWGKGLVNTYLPDDVPQGTLTSQPFTVQKRYIGFLIGGGSHPGETCINLLVDGKVVRTATGRDNERLEPHQWDVAEFKGRQAIIEIVDRHSGGWGHINIDHIVFSDYPPEMLMRAAESTKVLQQAMPLRAERISYEQHRRQHVVLTEEGKRWLRGRNALQWQVESHLKLQGFQPEDWLVLAQTAEGEPLLMVRRFRQGTIILCLGSPTPPVDLSTLFLSAIGHEETEPMHLLPAHPRLGSITVAADHPDPRFERWNTLGDLARSDASTGTHGALSVPLKLRPGQSRTVSFVLSWHYPNVVRFGHRGNLYARWFSSSAQVGEYVLQNLTRLWRWTQLYQQTMYQSNLPPLMLDAITSQAVILRSPTCFWSADGYFGGFEGSYGCCPLNCTHVWNYAQTHARLFPEIGRNMRESDLLVYLHPSGETSHRQHAPHNAFIDGQCATICAAYREHLTYPDDSFLKKVWPKVKLATDWLIRAIDADEDGVPAGHQWNTYDCAVSGANTFIGSQYLCALAAAEQMALLMGDRVSARRYRAIRLAGMRNQNVRLWNGDYYIQIPDTPPANDYNSGCHSDQLLGQWWAHQLGLGYLYPPERTRQALQAIFRYNFRRNMHGHTQIPRRYVPDDEGGLLMCTWPNGGRPNPFIIYADEVWTGIEYATAGLMLWEGMVDEAIQIVDMARSRYDGRKRDGLNSGPGGNPFNELECGKFYARAMSAFGLLLAAQGLVLDTPAGVLGFAPRWKPEEHRSFFITGSGWGLFAQKRLPGEQHEEIDLRYGCLTLRELHFEMPVGKPLRSSSVRLNGRFAAHTAIMEGKRVRLRFVEEQKLQSPATVKVVFRT